MELNATHSLQENLKAAQEAKKGAVLHLRSGATLTGPIGSVGGHFVVLKELSGKEFYDAVVRLEDVCAMEVRAR